MPYWIKKYIFLSYFGSEYTLVIWVMAMWFSWSKLDYTLHSHQTAQFFIICTYVCRRTVQGQLYLQSELQANLSALFKTKKQRTKKKPKQRISALSKQRNYSEMMSQNKEKQNKLTIKIMHASRRKIKDTWENH